MTTLSRKMLGYALGRTPHGVGSPLIGEMVASGATRRSRTWRSGL